MFSFLKTTSTKSKYTLLARFALVVVAGALLAVAAFISFAWFSENRQTDADGMRIVAATDRYELLVDRRTTYDSVVDYPDVSASGESSVMPDCSRARARICPSLRHPA